MNEIVRDGITITETADNIPAPLPKDMSVLEVRMTALTTSSSNPNVSRNYLF